MASEEQKRSLEECRRKLPMPDLWKALGLPGVPKKVMYSPFREEDNESFSVFQKDGRWFYKDHATGDAGDEVSLIEKVKGLKPQFAIACYHDMAGVEPPPWEGPKGGWHKKTTPLPGSKADIPKGFGKGEQKPDPAQPAATTGDEPKPAKIVDNKGKKKKKAPLGKVVAVYDYHDEDGKMVHQTLRFEPKNFRQRRPAVAGDEEIAKDGFVWSLDGIRTVLYHLPVVMGTSKETPIFFVEGEKDADNLRSLGLVATTVPMGAGKWRDDYTEMLEGKWVVLMGDVDPAILADGITPGHAGQKHIQKVVREITHSASRIGVIDLAEKWPECPGKGDISDWIAAQEDGADILSGTLIRWAMEARDPREWIGCIEMSDNGPYLVHYTTSEAMIKRYQVLYAGEMWWQWNGEVWIQLAVQRAVGRHVMQQLVELPHGVDLVSARSVAAIEDLMKTSTAKDPNELNQHDRSLINCRNGMLNIETGELSPHDPGHFSTVQIPWAYNPGATCPKWEQWLLERLPDDEVRGLVQEMFGYCLAGERINYHRFFFLFGDGGTGKSTVVDILSRMIGKQNTVSLQLEELDNPFTRAALVGKKLYMAAELTKDSLKHIGLVKAITSGNPVFVEKKHKDGYSYVPRGRLVMESNARASTPDSSDGFFRRLLQITFTQKLKRDQMDFDLPEKLAIEMEGIFYWSLVGLKRLMARGHFVETADSKNAAAQLEMHRASVKAFFDQCVEMVDVADVAAFKDYKQSATSLFTTYQEWCEWQHVKPYYDDAGPFSRELLNRIPELTERRARMRETEGRMMFYLGLKYRPWKETLGVQDLA